MILPETPHSQEIEILSKFSLVLIKTFVLFKPKLSKKILSDNLNSISHKFHAKTKEYQNQILKKETSNIQNEII